MKNASIPARLSVLIGFLSLLLAGGGVIGLKGISMADDALQTVYADRTVALEQLAHIQQLILTDIVLIQQAGSAADRGLISSTADKVEKDMAEAEKTWKAFMASHMTVEEERLAKATAAGRAAFDRDGFARMVKALRSPMPEEVRLVIEETRPVFAALTRDLDDLKKLQTDVAKEEYDAAVVRYRYLLVMSICFIVLGIALAIGFGAWITRSITRPLGKAIHVAETVASGDLTSDIRPEGTKETAQLLSALFRMNESLVKIVGTVRQGSDSIATGSGQIASGNADLSQRTEEQASNLEQTAASMEQLSGTVRNTADTARQATQLASSASEAATEGGRVVSQVVHTMEAISESSRKVGDIIGVIDSIAFQTNILALNAAVEAARAGEQGRGFAVVASEVRTLAKRSADAAHEIKSLIGSSAEHVQTGARLVSDAGRTMSDIVAQVKRVSDMIGEISSAAQEQTQGIGQVSDAVTQLDQVTQQNAALVEESAAAAESLNHQAGKLVEVVGAFRLLSA